MENEWLCAQLVSRLGLPAAPCEVATFEEHKVLVVERFDRALRALPTGAPWIARLPQEDFCQALGLAAEEKYESAGGPGMATILRQLETSDRSAADKLMFIKAQLAFWLMAAIVRPKLITGRPSLVRKAGMMVWNGRLPGATWLGPASRLKPWPRFCRLMPKLGSTQPEPNPM